MRYFFILSMLVCSFSLATAADNRPSRPDREGLEAKREAMKEKIVQFREQHGEGQNSEEFKAKCEAFKERLAKLREERGASGAGSGALSDERRAAMKERLEALRERRQNGVGGQLPQGGENHGPRKHKPLGDDA